MDSLNEISQEFADSLSIFQSDNRDISKKIPIAEALNSLFANPDNIEEAFLSIRNWTEENWVPIILEQSIEAQKQAVKTAFKW